MSLTKEQIEEMLSLPDVKYYDNGYIWYMTKGVWSLSMERSMIEKPNYPVKWLREQLKIMNDNQDNLTAEVNTAPQQFESLKSEPKEGEWWLIKRRSDEMFVAMFNGSYFQPSDDDEYECDGAKPISRLYTQSEMDETIYLATNTADKTIKQEREERLHILELYKKAKKSLECAGFTDEGGELWQSPVAEGNREFAVNDVVYDKEGKGYVVECVDKVQLRDANLPELTSGFGLFLHVDDLSKTKPQTEAEKKQAEREANGRALHELHINILIDIHGRFPSLDFNSTPEADRETYVRLAEKIGFKASGNE